jgi:hypothetical protein
MEVILRVTVVVKKMMVVLETLGPPPTIACQHNNQKRPNHCQKIKTQVLPTA